MHAACCCLRVVWGSAHYTSFVMFWLLFVQKTNHDLRASCDVLGVQVLMSLFCGSAYTQACSLQTDDACHPLLTSRSSLERCSGAGVQRRWTGATGHQTPEMRTKHALLIQSVIISTRGVEPKPEMRMGSGPYIYT